MFYLGPLGGSQPVNGTLQHYKSIVCQGRRCTPTHWKNCSGTVLGTQINHDNNQASTLLKMRSVKISNWINKIKKPWRPGVACSLTNPGIVKEIRDVELISSVELAFRFSLELSISGPKNCQYKARKPSFTEKPKEAYQRDSKKVRRDQINNLVHS